MALGGAERWEIDLAVEAALDHHHEASTPVATDEVCDMHGILDGADRQLVRERVALRIALEEIGVAA
jgi:hypothetical protein